MATPVGGGPPPDTTPPGAPASLTATASSATQVDLAWPAATDNVAVTGYRLERCTGAGCTTFAEIATPTGLTASDPGRTASTTYRYRVRASDAAGNLGAYSPIATVTTPAAADTTPPGAPASLTATASSATQVDLAWPAATDNVAVTGYRLERCTGAGCTTFAEIATPTGLTASDPGRTASTTYRYRVRASDAAGNLGAYSPIATVTTPAAADTTPPGAPASLTATASSATQVDLAWPAATDNVAVTGYRLERCTGAGCTTFAEIATPTGLTASDPGRTASTTYRYRVRASDAAGNLGAYSPIATVTTPAAADTTPPGAPASLTATASSATQVDLAWPAATDNVAVTGYRLERCTGAGCTTFAEIATPTGLTASDPGRTASTTYRYQVRASDAAGNLGAYSPIATVTTPAVQPPPTGLVAAYAFDETAGTTAGDASGNANTGTLQTGAGWTAAGHAGGALVLDGSSGRVRVPASSSLGLTSAMTLEAWIRPSVAQGGWRTVLQRETDAYFLNASNDTGALRPSGGGTFGVTTAFVTGTTPSPVGVWTHVALTYDGATLRLYVNGKLVTSAARTGTIQASPNPLWIGGNSPYGEFFAGSIDDARVYNRALSATELATDMATPVGP